MVKFLVVKCNILSLLVIKKYSINDECIKFVVIKIIVLVVIDD